MDNEITDAATQDAITRQLFAILGVNYFSQRNPAPQPVSLARVHLERFLTEDYLVCDKSDGVRLLLFLTTIDGKAYAVLVDRKLSFFEVRVAAARSYFQGSVFDGELVSVQDCDLFLVFDCYSYKGGFQGHRQLLDRLSLLRDCFQLEGEEGDFRNPNFVSQQAGKGKIICGGSSRGLSFRAKSFFQLRQLDTLLRQMKRQLYPSDGLIFTPNSGPVEFGTSFRTFKFKEAHTLDVQTSEAGTLLLGLGGGPESAAQRVELLQAEPLAEPSREVLTLAASQPGKILEVLLQWKDGRLRLEFQKMRNDKSHPNTVATLRKTLESLRDELSVQEILAHAIQAARLQDDRRAA